MRLIILAALYAFHAAPLVAQRVDSANASRVGTLLATLAHDSLEGRDTGARGAAAAARIIAAELERAGLRPGGDSGFFQRVPIAWQMAPNRQGVMARRMRVQTDFATRDTFPVADRVPAVNVIGMIQGSDPVLRGEAVVLTAHYDHTGVADGSPRCAAIGSDTICNGADDDASGTVAVIEVARMLARANPRRTIIALLVVGEERGLLGTSWYIDHPVIPLARTVANLNFEMIGRPDPLAGGPGKGWLTGYNRSSMGRILSDAGVPLVPDPRPDQRFFERSDNVAFARRGIPAHSISSYNMHTDYHTPTDEARLADSAHMAAIINASARAAKLLADGPPPVWAPGDTFGRIPRN